MSKLILPEQTFWNHKNPLCKVADELHKLIPASGQVEEPRKNRALEKYRKAVNAYYDLYNNGLCNRAHEFRQAFGIASSKYKLTTRFAQFDACLYAEVEPVMEQIVVKAAYEQGIAIDCVKS